MEGHGDRNWDADSGDDSKDPACVFRAREADQGDLPRAWCVTEGGAEGRSFGGDGVPVPEDGPTPAEAGAVAVGAGRSSVRQCREGAAGAADADPGLRG